MLEFLWCINKIISNHGVWNMCRNQCRLITKKMINWGVIHVPIVMGGKILNSFLSRCEIVIEIVNSHHVIKNSFEVTMYDTPCVLTHNSITWKGWMFLSIDCIYFNVILHWSLKSTMFNYETFILVHLYKNNNICIFPIRLTHLS